MTRRYRVTTLQLVGAIFTSVIFLAVGATILSAPGQTGPGGVVVGILGVVIACAVMASVRSLRVSNAPGRGNWSCLTVDLTGQGAVKVKAIAGSRRYVERTIAEFEAFAVTAAAPGAAFRRP
jgi:hypothetical protein